MPNISSCRPVIIIIIASLDAFTIVRKKYKTKNANNLRDYKTDWVFLILDGNAFQSLGAAMANARSP